MRNSLLAKELCAENLTGLELNTEITVNIIYNIKVEECSIFSEARL